MYFFIFILNRNSCELHCLPRSQKDSGLIWVNVKSETHSRDLTLEFDSVVALDPYMYFK